jgi:hypothetical protein
MDHAVFVELLFDPAEQPIVNGLGRNIARTPDGSATRGEVMMASKALAILFMGSSVTAAAFYSTTALGRAPSEIGAATLAPSATPAPPNQPAADSAGREVRFRRHSVGSSLFMLYNLAPIADTPSFYQLNYNFRASLKDVVSLEAITWKYYAPLGIPWGSAMSAAENQYPGSVRSFGLGVAYKRFLWRGVYAAVHALPLHQTYLDESNKAIQRGFQLFITLRAGYHLAFFKERFFIEPSIAATTWPINTNLPADFAAKEKNWRKYFLAEPGLHFGVNF